MKKSVFFSYFNIVLPPENENKNIVLSLSLFRINGAVSVRTLGNSAGQCDAPARRGGVAQRRCAFVVACRRRHGRRRRREHRRRQEPGEIWLVFFFQSLHERIEKRVVFSLRVSNEELRDDR